MISYQSLLLSTIVLNDIIHIPSQLYIVGIAATINSYVHMYRPPIGLFGPEKLKQACMAGTHHSFPQCIQPRISPTNTTGFKFTIKSGTP